MPHCGNTTSHFNNAVRAGRQVRRTPDQWDHAAGDLVRRRITTLHGIRDSAVRSKVGSCYEDTDEAASDRCERGWLGAGCQPLGGGSLIFSLHLAIASLLIVTSGTVDTTTANVLRFRPPASVTTGGASDAPVPRISEESYQGGVQFTVSVDDEQLDGTFPNTASHTAGATQSFTFQGDRAVGTHAVAAHFPDDALWWHSRRRPQTLRERHRPFSSNATFHVSGGQIIGPDEQPFKAHGIDILESTLGSVVGDSNGGALLKNFPGTNMVRIAMESGYSSYNDPAFVKAVNWLTAKGIVVEIGNYNTNGSVATGQGLTDEVNWFAALASKYKSNPYVWFSTDNEPIDGKTFNGATTAEQLAAYNAIRGTGNTSMIGIEDTFATLNPANYASMTNVHWDSHYYNWNAGYSTDLAKNEVAIRSRNALLNSLFKSADGTIPIISGEFGNSTDGNTIDPGGTQAVQAVLNVSPSYSGWTSWLYHWPGTPTMGDELLNQSTGQLTAYGQQIAGALMGQQPPPQGPALPPRTSLAPVEIDLLSGVCRCHRRPQSATVQISATSFGQII